MRNGKACDELGLACLVLGIKMEMVCRLITCVNINEVGFSIDN